MSDNGSLELLRRVVSNRPRGWTAALWLLVALSSVEVVTGHGATQVKFRVTPITVVLVTLVWLPAILRIFAIGGARLSTPAGEFQTNPILQYLLGAGSAPLRPQETVAGRLGELEAQFATVRNTMPRSDL